jgi:hypothetical protein
MKTKIFFFLILIIITTIALWIIGLLDCAYAEIDMDIIAIIESNNNPLAYNFKSKARGLYQITPICLEDYNNYHKHKYTLPELFNPIINKKITKWYIEKRIPQMLNYYGYKATDKNIIISYNAGIKYIVKGLSLPQETRLYLKKYHKLLKQKKLQK